MILLSDQNYYVIEWDESDSINTVPKIESLGHGIQIQINQKLFLGRKEFSCKSEEETNSEEQW